MDRPQNPIRIGASIRKVLEAFVSTTSKAKITGRWAACKPRRAPGNPPRESNRQNTPNNKHRATNVMSKLMPRAQRIPIELRKSAATSECTLHQLSPYIGKLKSSIARFLILEYTKPGDLVVDPFCGSGTIPLEAALTGRTTFACDTSDYAALLSTAKLNPPRSEQFALEKAKQLITEAMVLPVPDLRTIPRWVRDFFNRDTLKDVLRFAKVARREGNEFWFACFLGILHHQRPGFLSYPSSHLVPYLRDRKYPRTRYPELYQYRALTPRLEAKIRRVFKRMRPLRSKAVFERASAELANLPPGVRAIITSPPYMNALDYERDNRLRLWFIDPSRARFQEQSASHKRKAFIDVMSALIKRSCAQLDPRGYFILVIGEEVKRTFRAEPSEVVHELVAAHAPSLSLKTVFTDAIPDVRRGRRYCRGIKQEKLLIYQKE